MNLFSELKRRNVFKVGVAYLVVAWLLIQVVATLGNMLDLPESVGRTILLLLVIGFPVAVVVSWVYEVTAEGITTQQAVDAGAVTTSGRKLNAVIVSALVLAVVFMAVDNYVLVDPTTEVFAENTEDQEGPGDDPAIIEKSIAVLPFANISNDPEQEYFVDGLTEELINRLSAVNGLLVTGRTSAFYFKGSEESPGQIAESLGVNHVLQGTVRKAGDQLRIAATLMGTSTGFNLWTDSYDFQLANIFDIQNEIATQVTIALSVTLGAGDFDRPGMTRNADAYDLYMQATGLGFSSAPELVLDRIEKLERAVVLDTNFAMAWLKLSYAHRTASSLLESDQATVNLESAGQALERATSLAPDMRELLTDGASVVGPLVPGSYLERERALVAALQQSGNVDSQLNAGYAGFLLVTGRVRESLDYARRAYRQDPYNVPAVQILSLALIANRRYDEARDSIDISLMLADYQTGSIAWPNLAFVQMLEQDLTAALATTANMVATRTEQTRLLELMLAGDNAGALDALRSMMADPQTNVGMRERHLPVFAALMGEPELSLEVLTSLPSPSGVALIQMWLEFGDTVRPLPGFKAYMEEVGLADYWRNSGKWPDFCRPLPDSDTEFECFQDGTIFTVN